MFKKIIYTTNPGVSDLVASDGKKVYCNIFGLQWM